MEAEEGIKHSIGYVLGMDVELSKPFPMNFIDFEVNKLTMLTGMNGTGKSIIMKLNWITNILAGYCAVSQDHPTIVDFEKEINFIFDNTFTDNNFTGTITARFENLEMKLELEEGKYKGFTYSTTKQLRPSNPSFYLSSETRLLTDHVRYMRMRKALGITSPLGMLDKEEMDKMLTAYKIYDLLFIEYYLKNLDGFKGTEELTKAFEKVETKNEPINIVRVNLEDCTITNEDDYGEKINDLTLLSAGQQAVFVMFTSNKVLTN